MSTILRYEIHNEKADTIFSATIYTDIGEIKWVFESDSNCCEEFSIILDTTLSDLIGKQFVNVDLETECTEKDDFSKSTKSAILILKLNEDKIWKARFFNYHNGYYSHNLDIFIDGKIKWNVAL